MFSFKKKTNLASKLAQVLTRIHLFDIEPLLLLLEYSPCCMYTGQHLQDEVEWVSQSTEHAHFVGFAVEDKTHLYMKIQNQQGGTKLKVEEAFHHLYITALDTLVSSFHSSL